MIFVDDRTPEEKKTHTTIVLMTDAFLSGWGQAGNGPHYTGWACTPEIVDDVERCIRQWGKARRVRIVGGDYRPSHGGEGYCHIYVWNYSLSRPCDRCRKVKRYQAYKGSHGVSLYLCRPCARELGYKD